MACRRCCDTQPATGQWAAALCLPLLLPQAVLRPFMRSTLRHTSAVFIPLPSVVPSHPAAILPHDRPPADPSLIAVPRPLAPLPPSLPLRS